MSSWTPFRPYPPPKPFNPMRKLTTGDAKDGENDENVSPGIKHVKQDRKEHGRTDLASLKHHVKQEQKEEDTLGGGGCMETPPAQAVLQPLRPLKRKVKEERLDGETTPPMKKEASEATETTTEATEATEAAKEEYLDGETTPPMKKEATEATTEATEATEAAEETMDERDLTDYELDVLNPDSPFLDAHEKQSLVRRMILRMKMGLEGDARAAVAAWTGSKQMDQRLFQDAFETVLNLMRKIKANKDDYQGWKQVQLNTMGALYQTSIRHYCKLCHEILDYQLYCTRDPGRHRLQLCLNCWFTTCLMCVSSKRAKSLEIFPSVRNFVELMDKSCRVSVTGYLGKIARLPCMANFLERMLELDEMPVFAANYKTHRNVNPREERFCDGATTGNQPCGVALTTVQMSPVDQDLVDTLDAVAMDAVSNFKFTKVHPSALNDLEWASLGDWDPETGNYMVSKIAVGSIPIPSPP